LKREPGFFIIRWKKGFHKMKIVISHIQQDLRPALILKKWIENGFGNSCEALLSTDPESIPLFPRLVEENENTLANFKALILVCSPDSLQRPWISFEAGCAWMKKVLVLPVCYSGATPAELPPPLTLFSAFDLNDEGFPEKLFSALAKEMGLPQLPEIAYDRMRREILQLKESIHSEAAPSPPGPEWRNPAGKPLEPIHLEILETLADSYGYTSGVIGEHFKMEERKIAPLLKRLIDENYVYASPAGMGKVRYNLTTAGKAYLQENRPLKP
jgi:DNA-binding MarR family transcriptional regulator